MSRYERRATIWLGGKSIHGSSMQSSETRFQTENRVTGVLMMTVKDLREQ